MCSQCEIQVKKDNNVYREYLETLEYLYPNEGEEEIIEEKVENAQDSGNIFVTTMSGELLTLSYHRNKRIIDLKKEVQVGLKTEPEKQRLLYQNNELKVSQIKLLFLNFLKIMYSSIKLYSIYK